jgi:chemotaxis protein CheD
VIPLPVQKTAHVAVPSPPPAPTAIYLHPGDVACGTRGDRFETLLGSCVAIILTDPRRTVGAICHIVHATVGTSAQRGNTAHAGPALASLFQRLRCLGIEPRLCEAYVYGGGNMFPTLTTGPQVGDRNADWVINALVVAGVRIVVQDVGGHGYRRLGWTVGPAAPQVTTIDV